MMQKIICKALEKGRLAYKVLDQNFQASGGGHLIIARICPPTTSRVSGLVILICKPCWNLI